MFSITENMSELIQAVLDTKTLSDFKKTLRESNCKACPLGSCYATNRPVVSRGSLDARLMVIGEAPGAQEALDGFPFVGRAGKLADDMFTAVGLNPKTDIYWSNTARCRPTDNREPTAEEAKLCRGYLVHEIKLLKPRVIICLGKTAARYLLPDKVKSTDSMGSLSGRSFVISTLVPGQDVVVYIIYHPAFHLRPGGADKKAETVGHLKNIKAWMVGNAVSKSITAVEPVKANYHKMRVNPPLKKEYQ